MITDSFKIQNSFIPIVMFTPIVIQNSFTPIAMHVYKNDLNETCYLLH